MCQSPFRIYLVSFRDSDRMWYPVDETGFNKVGYLTRRQTVIHPWFNHRLRETAETRIRIYPHTFFQRAAHSQSELDNVERFFTENKPSIELFNSGMAAIVKQNDLTYFENPIRIPVLDPITVEEFDKRWQTFCSILRLGDIIAVIDNKSILSRLIAHFDRGTWSHVGVYSGEGKLVEAVLQGVVEGEIEDYHSPRYRLGVYRRKNLRLGNAQEVVARMRSQIGAKYNFYG